MHGSVLKTLTLCIELFVLVVVMMEKNSHQAEGGKKKKGGGSYNCKYDCNADKFVESESHCATHPCSQDINFRGQVRRRQVKTWNRPCVCDC